MIALGDDMKKIDYDNNFFEKIKKVFYYYDGKIPDSLYYYYNEILEGKNIAVYMQTYSLSEHDLKKYAIVCKIMAIYKEIIELIDFISKEENLLDKDDIEEYQRIIAELYNGGKAFLNNIDFPENQELDKLEDENNTNLLIYPSFIEESKQRTLNSHSGREEMTLKNIANLIEQLRKVDYQNLRKKGYIHQHVDNSNKKPCYIEGNAFERFGRLTTKVNYIRVPINEKNREIIKRQLNIDFDTLYLVVYYGDFKNEGYDEYKFYNEVYLSIQKHMNELVTIINIFKKDFTPETLDNALSLIKEGFIITDDLITVDRNR